MGTSALGRALEAVKGIGVSQWTATVEYVSAERKLTTGKFTVRDEAGNYVGSLEGGYAKAVVLAMNGFSPLCKDVRELSKALHAAMVKIAYDAQTPLEQCNGPDFLRWKELIERVKR